MMFPKPQRIRNKKLYLSYKKDFCEWCGVWHTQGNLERHHIIKRSQGGGDEHSNLIMLCTLPNDCHGKADRYEISKEDLRRAKDGGFS